MNVNSYGVQFIYGVGFDMSANTNLKLVFTKPDGTSLTVQTPNVTINASNVTTTAGTFSGNQYALYTFVNGDVNQAGTWSVRLTYTGSGVHLISSSANFTVSP